MLFTGSAIRISLRPSPWLSGKDPLEIAFPASYVPTFSDDNGPAGGADHAHAGVRYVC